MSLILEALKKSEDKRRLGAAPDLATPFSAPRRRSWVWPLAALIVVAGVVAWALRPSAPPPQPANAAVAPKKDTAHGAATPAPGQKSGAPLHSVPGNNDVTQTAAPQNLPKSPPPAPAQTVPSGQFVFGQPNADASGASLADRGAAGDNARGARRNGQLADRPNGLNSRAGAVSPTTAAATPAPSSQRSAIKPSAAQIVSPPAATKPVAPAATPTASSPTIAAPPDAAPARAPKSAATVGLTPPSTTPAATAQSASSTSAQPYSELTFSVRKSLPELKLSMHVYATEPSHRFVVLNDSRLTEGEKTNDEIFVREIRPDGVVLEFQNQRFFYPRDGL